MTFNHGLIIGKGYSSEYLYEVFKHDKFKGMRYSSTTNTLCLISDHVKSPYEDRWVDGVIHYNGMGLEGNQKIDSGQNKNLAESNETNIDLLLFEAYDNSKEKNIFMGRVILFANPYIEMQYDKNNKYREVWVFPLRPIDLDGRVLFDKNQVEKAEVNSAKIKEVKRLDDDELYQRALNSRTDIGARTVTTKYYQRNLYVTEYTKRRANGMCELCENLAPFRNYKGEPYLESHHIEWLSEGGEDSISNTAALCPNCHRRMHSLNSVEDKNILTEKAKQNLG